MTKRCWWPGTEEIYIAYHDKEWGVPIHDDRLLFEFICLEGQQAGLSWITILKKRGHYRKCFKNFEIDEVARLTDKTIEKHLLDAGLIRNRLNRRFFFVYFKRKRRSYETKKWVVCATSERLVGAYIKSNIKGRPHRS